MQRNHRWRQQFAAKFDQLGQRLGSGRVVGMHAMFTAIPFTTWTSEISTMREIDGEQQGAQSGDLGAKPCSPIQPNETSGTQI